MVSSSCQFSETALPPPDPLKTQKCRVQGLEFSNPPEEIAHTIRCPALQMIKPYYLANFQLACTPKREDY